MPNHNSSITLVLTIVTLQEIVMGMLQATIIQQVHLSFTPPNNFSIQTPTFMGQGITILLPPIQAMLLLVLQLLL